jgi:hypothetical protein
LVWPALKEEFIKRRLDGEPLSLAAFAKEKATDASTMERHSSAEGWFAAIEQRALERQQAVETHSARVVQQLRHYLNRDEMATRREHAAAMRDLIDIATRKLENMDPDQLSVDEMIAIMRFAPAQERLALGFPDMPSGRVYKSGPAAAKAHFETLCRQRQEESQAYEEFEKHAARRERTAAALSELSAILEHEQEQP